MDDPVWVPIVFTKNRERLIKHDAIIELFNLVLEQAEDKGLLSGEHFSVDGTLIQAWAGHKSFVRKDRSDDDGDNIPHCAGRWPAHGNRGLVVVVEVTQGGSRSQLCDADHQCE